jgi:hypothetical protein
MPKINARETDNKSKLKAKLEAMRIARGGLENAYKKLSEWNKLRKRLRKQKKNVDQLDIKIEVLRDYLDRIEENAANMQHSGPVDGAVGLGSGGGSGCDQG